MIAKLWTRSRPEKRKGDFDSSGKPQVSNSKQIFIGEMARPAGAQVNVIKKQRIF